MKEPLTCVDCEFLQNFLRRERDAHDYFFYKNGPVVRAIEIMKADAKTIEQLKEAEKENEALKSIIHQLQKRT